MTNDDLIAVAGNTFVVSDLLGNILPVEQHGVFAADTRFLSRFELKLGDLGVILLRSGPAAFAESQIYLSNAASDTVAGQTLEIVRKRQLRRTSLTETIECANHGLERVDVPLQLWLEADFADIFEVRSMSVQRRSKHTRHRSTPDGVTFFDTVRENERQIHVQFSHPPDEHAGSHVTFNLSLESHQRWSLEIQMRWAVPVLESHRPVPVARDIGHQSVLEWIRQTPRLHTDDQDFERGYQRSIRDLGALEIALNSGQPIPAAGLPWYLAIFGRDSIVTSLQTMLLNQRHARGTLTTLGAYQAREDDPFRDAEPGKIAHEIRFGELAISDTVPHSRYYGSVDSTPLWLILFGEYMRWVDDQPLLHDLLPVAERALEWIDRYGDLDGDGFIEYSRRSTSGLVNQGWKDSWDSVRFADGRIAEGPIALVEVQGYVYAARLAMAGIYDMIGQTAKASELRAQADRLRYTVQESFWMPGEGYFAMALDGQKRQVDGITSNPGHLLWAGLPDPDKAARVVERLMAADLYSGWGVRTMSTEMTAFSPISYHNGSVWPHDNSLIIAGMHRYGHDEAACRVIGGLIDASRWFEFNRLPELFCGYDREQTPFPVNYPVACSPQAWAAGSIIQMVQIMLGIDVGPDGLRASPISDRVTGLTNVLFRGERFDIEGDRITRSPQMASTTATVNP
ncbi:MAG TPA: glycogen debranching N-terminal domain-containing protein [Nitrolancea sp.]|nr:glycogen debranching N-terminal domain-containing protein [Nitrolancea sp.]